MTNNINDSLCIATNSHKVQWNKINKMFKRILLGCYESYTLNLEEKFCRKDKISHFIWVDQLTFKYGYMTKLKRYLHRSLLPNTFN